MPIKVKLKKGDIGNKRGGTDANAKTRNSRRQYRFYDPVKKEYLDPATVVKAPVGMKPLEITPQVHNKIVLLIKKGNYVNVAIRASGISMKTFLRWMEKASLDNIRKCKTKEDLKEIEPYVRLAHDVHQASAEAESDLLEVVQGATQQDWQAARFILERKFPKRWGRKNIIDKRVSGTIRHQHEEVRKILSDPDTTAEVLDEFESDIIDVEASEPPDQP